MIEPYLIESVLSSLFDFLKKKVITAPSDRAKFDFIIKDEKGKKIAIEVKGQNITVKTLLNIERALEEYKDLDEFYLITLEEPQKLLYDRFKGFFKKNRPIIYWMGINQFIERQNLGIELNDDIRNALLNLQVAAVISKFEDYSKQNIGSHLGTTDLTAHLKKNIQNVKEGKVDRTNVLFGLRRQFPYSIIAELEKNPDQLPDRLSFGKKYDEAIIIPVVALVPRATNIEEGLRPESWPVTKQSTGGSGPTPRGLLNKITAPAVRLPWASDKGISYSITD